MSRLPWKSKHQVCMHDHWELCDCKSVKYLLKDHLSSTSPSISEQLPVANSTFNHWSMTHGPQAPDSYLFIKKFIGSL